MTDRNDVDFGPIADNTGYQLRRLDVLMIADIGERLARLGLTPVRATALIYVGLHEACDQSALGNALGINRASAMAVVNHLVALNAVERRPGRDRRSNALYLTTAGRELSDDAMQVTFEHDAEFFAVLTDSERCEFDRLIRKTRSLNQSRQPATADNNDRPVRMTRT